MHYLIKSYLIYLIARLIINRWMCFKFSSKETIREFFCIIIDSKRFNNDFVRKLIVNRTSYLFNHINQIIKSYLIYLIARLIINRSLDVFQIFIEGDDKRILP